MEFSDKMKANLGKTLVYHHPRTGVEITGVCDQIRWSGSYITNCNEDWKTSKKWSGFELRLKPLDGSRAVWTKAFPSDVEWPS